MSARTLHQLVLMVLFCLAVATLQFFAWRAWALPWAYSLPISLTIGFGIGYAIRKWV